LAQQPHPHPGLPLEGEGEEWRRLPLEEEGNKRDDFNGLIAALIAGAWMLLPINLTGVLYVVQRMESLANLFVLLGLVGYMAGRQRMLAESGGYRRGLLLCIASLVVSVAIGVTAKETAVMLPLYAFLIEWIVFGFGIEAPLPSVRPERRPKPEVEGQERQGPASGRDKYLMTLFAVVLLLPLIAGLAWMLPGLLHPEAWAKRDFTMETRLLSEARIVVGYIAWTLLPLPQWLSFYHDDYVVSTGLLHPWTTLASILAILALLWLAWIARKRRPLVTLGIALYFGCHLLTATILPLELIYEHRNYFASFGLLLAVVPLLAAPLSELPLVLARRALLAALAAWWVALTAFTAWSWGNPLRLADNLAVRGPESPRAQYELGRTLIVLSHYDPDSPLTPLVYAPLERAAALPKSSILPQQALIFMNSRMHRPIKEAWWDSMIAKLKSRPPGVQDDSSLSALTKCARDGACPLDKSRMVEAFMAALSHPDPSARLLATYGDYAWNILDDHALGMRMTEEAVKAQPGEPAYHITVARMAAVLGQPDVIQQQIEVLRQLNYGGRLDGDIAGLQDLLPTSAH
jgi:hypothetical protein